MRIPVNIGAEGMGWIPTGYWNHSYINGD